MPALGFSIQKEPVGLRRRSPADIRHLHERDKEKSNDAGFVVAMISLGVTMLAVAAYHDEARALLAQVTAMF